MDKVERAARHLRQVAVIKDGQIVNATEAVRTILAELREPDEGMTEAGIDARLDGLSARTIWQAMIDKALKSPIDTTLIPE